ncbi:MAG: DUF6446 family protein [Pseudomonadota bacterium]
MSGRLLMSGLVLFCVIFGAALWYFQIYAYYERINGVTNITAGQGELAVSGYDGIEAATSPLKLRACFTLADEFNPEASGRETATPLTAPHWFTCFDAEQIARDIQSGAATAVLAARNESDGVDRYLAVYPDGRGFMWRQLNEKFAEQ